MCNTTNNENMQENKKKDAQTKSEISAIIKSA